jgi:Uma2 family endonuclease
MAGVSVLDPRVSFAELSEWPEDGRRYELYDGEVIVVPAPFPRHQRVAVHIGQILADYERSTGGIMFSVPIDIVFTEFDVLQPDAVFFRQERRHLIKDWEATRIPPDLAVEVLSRSTEKRDRGRKMELLARYGVPEYWIVDPVRSVLEIYQLQDGKYQLSGAYKGHERVSSPGLEGLTFDVQRIFED